MTRVPLKVTLVVKWRLVKSDTGGEMETRQTRPEAREVGDSSMNVEEASQSFWHSEFDFRRYGSDPI